MAGAMMPNGKHYYADDQVTLWHGDALAVSAELPAGAADCIVTSPPYFGLRDYGTEGQYGLESSPSLYVARMRRLFSELHRVLADDGTLWLNIGDSYSGAGPSGASYQSETTKRRDAGNGVDGVFRVSKRLKEQGLDYSRKKPKPTGGIPSKNLLGIPWRVAFALQDDGWILRNAVIWHKPNAMPESVRDRLSGRYEHVFLFSKSRKYWFDLDPIRERCITEDRPLIAPTRERIDGSWSTGSGGNHQQPTKSGLGRKQRRADEPANAGTGLTPHSGYRGTAEAGRNPGDVWTIPTTPFSEAHFAVMPVQLAQRCILSGCKPGGTVLDPFSGSGTTGLAAQRTGRKYIGIDLNAEYLDLSLKTRLQAQALDFQEGA